MADYNELVKQLNLLREIGGETVTLEDIENLSFYEYLALFTDIENHPEKYKKVNRNNIKKYNSGNKILDRARNTFENIWDCTGRDDKLNDTVEYNLDMWTLRDFVSEAQYEMDMRENDIYDSEDRKEYNMYKRFVNTYSKYLTDDVKCYTKHISKYDLI